MEITSLNHLKITGVAFKGLTMAYFQISNLYHSLVHERKEELPHPIAETSLQ